MNNRNSNFRWSNSGCRQWIAGGRVGTWERGFIPSCRCQKIIFRVCCHRHSVDESIWCVQTLDVHWMQVGTFIPLALPLLKMFQWLPRLGQLLLPALNLELKEITEPFCTSPLLGERCSTRNNSTATKPPFPGTPLSGQCEVFDTHEPLRLGNSPRGLQSLAELASWHLPGAASEAFTGRATEFCTTNFSILLLLPLRVLQERGTGHMHGAVRSCAILSALHSL